MILPGSNYEFQRFPEQKIQPRNDHQYKDYKNRWTIYEKADIDMLKAEYIDDDMVMEYYNGLPCRMGYILTGKTVERETVRQIMNEEILGHNSKSHIAILDAGGEGKTTALMQLVIKLVESGKRVYYTQDAPELHIEYEKFYDNDIIVVDNANHVKNIYDFLSIATSKGVRVIFAARANEWEMKKINADVNRNIKGYKLSGFSDREKRDFAQLLSQYTELSESEIYEIFDNDSNQFLLAAMLRTMNGGINLDKIIEDIIMETKENLTGVYKEYALYILSILCLVEQTGVKMPMFLFRNICTNIGDGVKLNHKDLVSIYLKKEVQGTSTYIETRHPRISELFFKHLIEFIDIDLVYEEFSKAGRNIRNIKIDRVPEYLDIVGRVSLYMYQNYPELLSYIDYVIESNLDEFYMQYQGSCRELFRIWVDIKVDAIKSDCCEADSINTLYEKAICKWFISGNSELRYRFAKFHADNGNIGSIDEENTARWIYHQALVDNQLDESLLVAWTDLEATLGNYGTVDKPDPYTARWVFRWAINNEKATENLIYNWAVMEAGLDNYGEIDVEYSARWIYYWGITNNIANENMLMKWADMEIERENVGDVTVPYSALWIYHWGLTHNKTEENLLIKWTELEIKRRGLGDINTEYTARWIFNWGLNNKKADANMFIKWAEAEVNEDMQNIGQPEIPYTARWIYHYGFITLKNNPNLILRWIRQEFELGNIGPADKEYTVLWLLDNLYSSGYDDRSYYYWMIGSEMSLGMVETAYEYCKEGILKHDIYGIYALVQGERGVFYGEDSVDNFLLMAKKKESLLSQYCCYLCDILYKGGQQAEEIMDKIKTIGNNDSIEYYNKGFLRFWNDKAVKNGLM